jgi:hypothetical protein
MRRPVLRRPALWVAAVSLMTCATVMTLAPAAGASTNLVCGNGGSGYCLNAWNGGPFVKMYYGGSYGNDQFYLNAEYVCDGYGYVMSTAWGDPINCPFSNVSYDNEYRGDSIAAILYVGSPSGNLSCVGTGNLNGVPDVGYLGGCGDGYGNGIIQGGLFVVANTSYCTGLYQGVLINRYWTDQDNQPAYALSGGNPGQPLYVGATGSGTCWGGSGVQ